MDGTHSVCMIVLFSQTPAESVPYEKSYQATVKPIVSFLYAHPDVCVSLSFTGPQIDWLSQKHPESLSLIAELTKRRQVEVLGGGYYDPLFPLLLPADRSAQIEKLSSLLASTTGKRPRGMCLFESVWEPSLITTVQSCNMEFVCLESTLIPPEKPRFFPVITGEQGKNIRILPLHPELVPHDAEPPAEWAARIGHAVQADCDRCGGQYPAAMAVSCIPFCATEFAALIKGGYAQAIPGSDVPQRYLKAAGAFVPSYVPAGMGTLMSRWSLEPYAESPGNGFPHAVQDFLGAYPETRRLYERMMHLSLRISQYHGDKARKQAAREKLWLSQTGTFYASLADGRPASARERQLAYHALNEADGIITVPPVKEGITCYDYDADGFNEYVCAMERFSAVISLTAGTVTELNVRNGGGNYAASLSRMQEFDGTQDGYRRGIFVEHLFERVDMERYLRQEPVESGVFSSARFAEKKFDSKRREVQLEGRGEFSSLNLPVSLRKNILATSGGISVQYILKNEGPLALKALFVAELNFAQTVYDGPRAEYAAEAVCSGTCRRIDPQRVASEPGRVSLVRLTSPSGNTAFVIEPNEEAGLAWLPLQFMRPGKNELCAAARTSCLSLFWEVDLAAGMETEKTVSMGIVLAKKRASGK